MKTITFLAIAIATLVMPFMAGAKTNETKSAEPINSNANLDEMNIEENLEIETWMSNDSAWQLNQNPSNNFSKNATQVQLKIESWMTDDTLWFNSNEIVVNNQNLKIEQWMTDNKYWQL